MSFRRQMFLNHEDVHKLPNSLLINVNENQFRIFFTDDQITCFVCSSIGHTTSNCKKNNEVNSKNDPIEFNEMNTHDTTSDTLTEESPPSTTSDATVNSLQCSALPIYASFDVNSSDRAEEIFINNNNHPLSLLQFQYVIENFSNNAINIHSLCQQVNTDIPTLIDITEKIRPKISDRAMKSKLTKLANLLFKSMVPQED
jgi:hypothetical protein